MQTGERVKVTTVVFLPSNYLGHSVEVEALTDRVVLTDIGVHIHDEDGGSVCYPWHRIDHIVKRTVPVP